MRNRSPHLHISAALRLHRFFERPDQRSSVAKATALLGPDHQLVRVADLSAVLRRQLIVAALALGAGGVALPFDSNDATAVTAAAAAVELVLISTAAVLAAKQRSLIRDLLLSGQGHLPLRGLDRERERLTRPRTRARLARSLDDLVRTADRWPQINRSYRPVFDVNVVRAAAPLLTEIAKLLRSRPTPQQTLQIERLLTSGTSPLYGRDLHELLRELEHLKRQLKRDRNDP
jgi:hypothetical protein